VLLICPSRHRSAISNHIDNDSSSSSFASLRVDIQGVEDVSEAEQGTSAILTHFASRIKTDFIIIPCDFIPPPSLPLLRMLNMFRAQIGSEEGIVTSCWFETPNEKPSFEESDRSSTSIPIVWDAASSTLLHVSSASDHDKNNDELILRASLLARYETHLVAPRAAVNLLYPGTLAFGCLQSSRTLTSTFVGDLSSIFLNRSPDWNPSVMISFLGYVSSSTKLQGETSTGEVSESYWEAEKKECRTVLLVVVPLVKTDTQIAALQHSTMQSGSRSGARIPLSGTGSPEESEQDTSVSHASLRIGVVLHRLTDGCPTRVNTLNSFLDANRRVCLSDHGRA
jgi:translation initiation factor eIF-2B subunit gamma